MGAMRKKTLVKPPDAKTDLATLVKMSKRDLKESLGETSSLDNLANLAEALKKAKRKKK